MAIETDSAWVDLAQGLLAAIVAALAALGGTILANRNSSQRSQQELHDREMERQHRALDSLFNPLFKAYSDIYAALLACQEALGRLNPSQAFPIPIVNRLERSVIENALWLTSDLAEPLFATISTLKNAELNINRELRVGTMSAIAHCQQLIRHDLGIEEFQKYFRANWSLRR
jgi:hypothetical protein